MVDTLDDADRIRATWLRAAVDPDRTGRLFYSHLFQIAPGTRSLFGIRIEDQARKLTDTLAFIVDNLEDPQALRPAAHDLARRHVAYGVTEDQYQAVGQAVIATMKQLLGPGFTPEDEAAWARVYTALADDMIRVAYHA